MGFRGIIMIFMSIMVQKHEQMKMLQWYKCGATYNQGILILIMGVSFVSMGDNFISMEDKFLSMGDRIISMALTYRKHAG